MQAEKEKNKIKRDAALQRKVDREKSVCVWTCINGSVDTFCRSSV